MVYRLDEDQRLPQTRLAALTYAIVILTLLLLFGFWRLQILEGRHYAELAEKNRIRTISLIAPRGRILDREGRVLLDNTPSFTILLNRDNPDQLTCCLKEIAEGLGLDPAALEREVHEAAGLPRFQPIVIKTEASPADVAFVEAHRADLPALELLLVQRRRYPPAGILAHVLGYVGQVSPEDIARSQGRYRPGDVVGKAGIEREYNDILMGTDGSRRVVVDSRGRVRGTLGEVPAIPGHPIRLTIDLDLQMVAETELGDRAGAVVALNPQTGEVLAMASHPAFDPNLFTAGIRPEDWEQLTTDPGRPLLNRAIQAQLAPGSVFKIIMAAAMLESHAVPEDFRVFCPGSAVFYGHLFHCWEKGGHGLVDLHAAIVHSCDVYFYTVGRRLGIDRIAYFAHALGLGRKTGIDLPGEEPGLVPSPEWKQHVLHARWFPGETISVAIGQGATTVTPLQLAYSIGGIALGGVFHRPHLLADQPDQTVRFPLAPATVEQLTRAMYGVVNEGGTAAASRLEGIEFCGKTGSAQVVSGDARRRLNGQRFRDNAWFVGFAPRENPEIVVAVLVEGGEHGASAAAPIARELIRAYYEKKNGHRQQYTRLEWPPRPALAGSLN